uniref:Uncharacterized protein n=1 Tax=Arundo donax TaxID=35708 RepID=A0A0A9CVI7_ARUDO
MFERDPSNDLRECDTGAPEGRQQQRLAQHMGEIDAHVHLGFPSVDALLSSHVCGRGEAHLMRARGHGGARAGVDGARRRGGF